MDPPPAPSLTTQECLHLASLVPLHALHSAPSPVPAIVSTVFNLCRHRWVADFLFSPHLTPLTALTAPVNLNHSIVCTVTMTSVERFVGLPRCPDAPPNPFDIHMHGEYAFIPAFSVGPISVGFGIQHCAARCRADWGVPPAHKRASRTHFRYVRDDDRGILVNIRDEKDSDFYRVDYMEHQSATKRTRSFLTIERAAVQQLLREDSQGLDPRKLVTAIRLVQTSEEFRDCPYCGALKNSCDCKLQFQRPKHPLDFDNMVVNMSSHLGSFEGVTAARFCTAGMELMSARLGSRITIDCHVDAGLLDRLSKWAITDQLQGVREDPVRCIMPAADEEMADSGFGIDSGFGSGDVTDADLAGESGEQEMDTVREVDAFVEEMTRPMKDVSFVDVSADGLDRMLGLNKDVVDALATEGMFEQVSPATTEGDDEVELANEIAREAQLAYQAENAVEEHSVPSGTSTSIARGLDVETLQDDAEQSEEARVLLEKERKAELRRQRNREAAQRSNAKRKEKNDTLKAALRDTHRKAAELRQKELVLREENIQLRKMLSS